MIMSLLQNFHFVTAMNCNGSKYPIMEDIWYATLPPKGVVTHRSRNTNLALASGEEISHSDSNLSGPLSRVRGNNGHDKATPGPGPFGHACLWCAI